jgi:hypothetical protein
VLYATPRSFVLSREVVSQKAPGVLIVVAVYAEVLPVRSIGRVVTGVAILVMYR